MKRRWRCIIWLPVSLFTLTGCGGEYPQFSQSGQDITVEMKPGNQKKYSDKARETSNEVILRTREVLVQANAYYRDPENLSKIKREAGHLFSKLEKAIKQGRDTQLEGHSELNDFHVQFNEALKNYEKEQEKMEEGFVKDSLEETSEGSNQLEQAKADLEKFR